MRKAALFGLALASFGIATGPAASAGEEPVAGEDTDFVRLGPPRPGEWRHVFREPVQTFGEYRERMPRPHGGVCWRINVVAFGGGTGTLDQGSLSLLKEFLAAYFGTEVKLEPTGPLPHSVRRRPSRGFGTQILADDVLSFMGKDALRTLLPEAPFTGLPFPLPVARLGIVQTDLYGSSPDGGFLNFVFGMGAYGQKVAVISPARYSIRYEGEPEGVTPRKRVFKVAAHELGHVFGLAHCQTYGCCMNGSNSLPEADRRPIHLCPECLRKLEWCLAFDRRDRCRALEKLYRRLGWREEAEFAERRAALEPVLSAPEGTCER